MYDELTEVDIKKMEEEIAYRTNVLAPKLLKVPISLILSITDAYVIIAIIILETTNDIAEKATKAYVIMSIKSPNIPAISLDISWNSILYCSASSPKTFLTSTSFHFVKTSIILFLDSKSFG